MYWVSSSAPRVRTTFIARLRRRSVSKTLSTAPIPPPADLALEDVAQCPRLLAGHELLARIEDLRLRVEGVRTRQQLVDVRLGQAHHARHDARVAGVERLVGLVEQVVDQRPQREIRPALPIQEGRPILRR